MKQKRRQISIANSIDSEIVDFFEKQSNVSKTVMLGMQILYEIFGNIDINDYLPPGIEAHSTPVTFEKLFKMAHGVSYKDYVAPSEDIEGGLIPNLSGQQLQQILLALAQQPNEVAVPPATNEGNQTGGVKPEHHKPPTLVEVGQSESENLVNGHEGELSATAQQPNRETVPPATNEGNNTVTSTPKTDGESNSWAGINADMEFDF